MSALSGLDIANNVEREWRDRRRTAGVTLDDARLITAAPELLEACERLLNALPSATTHSAIKAARAAISKAKGE